MPRYNDICDDVTGQYVDLDPACPLLLRRSVELPVEARRSGVEVVLPHPALTPMENMIAALEVPAIEATVQTMRRLDECDRAARAGDTRALLGLRIAFACVKAQRREEIRYMTAEECAMALSEASAYRLVLDPAEFHAVEAQLRAAQASDAANASARTQADPQGTLVPTPDGSPPVVIEHESS